MKKVLIIAYLWPYRAEGAGRALGLAKFLPEFGWQPVVLTAPLGERPALPLPIVEVPYRDALKDMLGFGKRSLGLSPNQSVAGQIESQHKISYKKLFRGFMEYLGRAYEIVFNYPDGEKSWKPPAVRRGRELLNGEKIDALISSYPVTSHLVARELKGSHKVPWVADYADPWSQNHYYRYGPVRRLLDRRLEVKTMLSADAIVADSRPRAENLKALHKRETVYALPDGFDPTEVNASPARLTAKFTVTYTGSIYTGRQDPLKLFIALKDLLSDRSINPDDFEVRFYCGSSELADGIEEYGLSSIVKQYGIVPRQVILEKQRESQALLLLNWEDGREKGVYLLKGFEYLAARRPILATGGFGGDVMEELLTETKAGVNCRTVEDIKRAIKELYSEYKLKGEVAYRGDNEKADRYSYRELSRKYAEILDGLEKDKGLL